MARWNKLPRTLWTNGGMPALDPVPLTDATLYLYLMTCDRPTRIAGLMRGPLSIAEDTGWDLKGVRKGVRMLHRKGLLMVSERPSYILAPEALAFDLPDPGKATKGAMSVLAELPQVGPVVAAASIIQARSWVWAEKGHAMGDPEGHREGDAKPESREQGADDREQIPENRVAAPVGADPYLLKAFDDLGVQKILTNPEPVKAKPKKRKRRKAIERFAPNPSKACCAVYAHWHSKHPQADDAPDIEQDALIQALLDGGYSAEDLCHVIDVTHASDWHVKNRKLGLDFCLRAAHVKARLSEWKEHGATKAGPGWRQPANAYDVPGYEGWTAEQLLAEGDAMGLNGDKHGPR